MAGLAVERWHHDLNVLMLEVQTGVADGLGKAIGAEGGARVDGHHGVRGVGPVHVMKAQRYTPGRHDTRENPQASGGRDRGTELARRLRATSVTTLDRVTDWMGSHARGLPSAHRDRAR